MVFKWAVATICYLYLSVRVYARTMCVCVCLEVRACPYLCLSAKCYVVLLIWLVMFVSTDTHLLYFHMIFGPLLIIPTRLNSLVSDDSLILLSRVPMCVRGRKIETGGGGRRTESGDVEYSQYNRYVLHFYDSPCTHFTGVCLLFNAHSQIRNESTANGVKCELCSYSFNVFIATPPIMWIIEATIKGKSFVVLNYISVVIIAKVHWMNTAHWLLWTEVTRRKEKKGENL